MLTRDSLIDTIRQVLAQAGYYVSDRVDLRPVSFDVAARRDNELLLLKVLTNIDALSERVAAEMKVLARFLHARPVVIGVKSGAGALESGVVYERHGVPIVAPETFVDEVLHEAPPLVYAAPGGYYVRINGAQLGELRRRRNISLGELAKVAGVSRRSISMYEEGMSATVEAATRLEDFLETELIQPLVQGLVPRRDRPAPDDEPVPDAVETTEGFEREVYLALTTLGYEVVQTQRSPFNAISQQHKTLILTSVPRDDGTMQRKARLVANLAGVTERPGVFFVRRRTTRTQIEGSAVITHEELAKLSDPEDVVELILQRSKLRPVE